MNKTSIGIQKVVRDLFARCFPGFEIRQDFDALIPLTNHIINDDFSISGKVEGEQILYSVKVKYFYRKVETDLIDEFSEKIKSVKAQKGFFVCADGFCNSMKSYAEKKGIELVSVSDITGNRWKPELTVPLVYAHTGQRYFFNILYRTAVLLKMIQNYRVIKLDQDDLNVFRFENENHVVSVSDFVKLHTGNGIISSDQKSVITLQKKITFLKYPLLEFDPCDIELHVTPFSRQYLRYVGVEEYREIKKQISAEVIAPGVSTFTVPVQINESYVFIDELSVKPFGYIAKKEVAATV